MEANYCLVMITTPDEALASKIGTSLVSDGLAACAQTTTINSTYRWSSELHSHPEILVLLKTRTALLDSLIERVRDLHSYDAPEIVALPIIGGSADYLNWIDAQTRPAWR